MLTAAMGPLPLSPDDLTSSVMSELAEDVKAAFEKAQDVAAAQNGVPAENISTTTASLPASGEYQYPSAEATDPADLNSLYEEGWSLECLLQLFSVTLGLQLAVWNMCRVGIQLENSLQHHM